MDYLHKSGAQSEPKFSKKLTEVTLCTSNDIKDLGAVLPDDGVRVAVIFANMILKTFQDLDQSEKKREETEVEMLESMAECQRLSRDRKNWEERWRSETLTKSSFDVDQQNLEIKQVLNTVEQVALSSPNRPPLIYGSLSTSPNSETILSFPDNGIDPQSTKLKSLAFRQSLNSDEECLINFDSASSAPCKQDSHSHVDLGINDDLRISKEDTEMSVDKPQKETSLKMLPENQMSSGLVSSAGMKSPSQCESKIVKVCGKRPSLQSLKGSFSLPNSTCTDSAVQNCFDSLAAPSGGTETHKVTACQLPIKQAKVRVIKKSELEGRTKNRKAVKVIYKRQRANISKDFEDLGSPPSKKTFKTGDTKRASLGEMWCRLNIGNSKHGQD